MLYKQPDWEIWVDTNISPIIAKRVSEYTGFVTKSSYSLALHYMSDFDIYKKAQEQGNVILISKDADFPELISRLGAPPKLINLKVGNCDNRTLWEFLKPNIKAAVETLISSNIDIVDLE